MKAVVIGGTSGIGDAISTALSNLQYGIVTLSRSKSGRERHYVCDVGDTHCLERVLDKVASDNPSIDVLVCVVGFANPKEFQELTFEDWSECFAKNLFYVPIAFKKLLPSLLKSPNPRAITIGSQWSYKNGCPYMIPYVVAKHGLRALTKELGRLYPIRVAHICIPTTDTPGYRTVKAKLKGKSPSPFLMKKPAEPSKVARVIAHFIDDARNNFDDEESNCTAKDPETLNFTTNYVIKSRLNLEHLSFFEC